LLFKIFYYYRNLPKSTAEVGLNECFEVGELGGLENAEFFG